MVAASRRPAPDGLSALFDVFVLAQAVQELLVDAFAGAPLTPEEYAVYSQVLSTPRCTPTDLARELAAPLTTVSDWVRTFTARGHLAREVRVQDRRSYGVTLTAAGRRAHREANRFFEHANATFISAYERSEPDLRAVLQRAAAAAASARVTVREQAREVAS